MRQWTVERLTAVAFAFLGIQTAIRVIESDVAAPLRYGALCCLAVGTFGVVLAGFDVDLDRLPGQPSRSEVGGIIGTVGSPSGIDRRSVRSNR